MADETKIEQTERTGKAVSAAKYSAISGTLAGAIVSIFAWILSFWKIIIPPEVIISLTVIFSFFINIILARTGIISEE